MMKPDYENAARKATELIVERNICAMPMLPIPILKSMYPRVCVVTFAELAMRAGIARESAIMTFGANQDAVTSVRVFGGELRYTVVYNQMLPFVMVQRALARELGHIVLGHDGTKPDDVRTEEAKCFARHFLCPRPVLRAIQNAGIPLTTEVVGNVTGCFERCIAEMQRTPGCHVPAELNRKVHEQFSGYIDNFLSYQRFLAPEDQSSLANFGTFMDGYEE